MKTYAELLRDPRWQRKRLEILNRDEWACQCCLGEDVTLHVHHNKYEGDFPWECPDQYLITLCENCHKAEEDYKSVDLFSLVEGCGVTRFHLNLLMEAVRFRMSKSQLKPFWAFHDEVLRKLVPTDELTELLEFRSKEKGEVVNG